MAAADALAVVLDEHPDTLQLDESTSPKIVGFGMAIMFKQERKTMIKRVVETLSLKRLRRFHTGSSASSHGVSAVIRSRRIGAPMYWNEVYFSEENSTGKWVYVEVVNAIIEGRM
nr:DNA repair protein RAD4 [Tanacetum cinerariifolium]